jgi:hypothetical protein
MADCDFIQRMTRHRNYDRRVTALRVQFNQFMETEVITKKAHAVVRPLVQSMANTVADALEAETDCLTPEQLHRAYDDRCQAVLDQENELMENEQLTGVEHGLCRNILLNLEVVVKDALVSRFGASLA